MKIFLTQKTINDHKERYTPGNEADLIDMFFQEMKKNEESTIYTGIIKFNIFHSYLNRYLCIDLRYLFLKMYEFLLEIHRF